MDKTSVEENTPTPEPLPLQEPRQIRDGSRANVSRTSEGYTMESRSQSMTTPPSQPHELLPTTGSPAMILQENESAARLNVPCNSSNHNTIVSTGVASQTTAPVNTGVIMKSAELESPASATLRHRRSVRSLNSQTSSEQHDRRHPSSVEEVTIGPYNQHPEGGNIALPPVHRKPSLSAVRDNVPAGIQTDPNIATFKMCIDEASPLKTSANKQVAEARSRSCVASDEDDEDDFDWEVNKIHEDKDKKDAQGQNTEKIMRLQDDVCCRPLHRRIHPWITHLFKNALVIVLLLIPKLLLKHIHARNPNMIVLADNGRPYVAVVVSNHIGYYVIQFLTMALFKIIHLFGTVQIKIVLETYDALVPHIARTVWFFGLIALWGFLVHGPNCLASQSKLDETVGLNEGVDMQCRMWVFWWVYRCMWGLQAMNILYIIKRYLMQVISDRFEQDNSRFVELNFQGHVLDTLQKIKMPKFLHSSHRLAGLHAAHHRWTDKSSHWLKSPIASRPSSIMEDRPPTATVESDVLQNHSILQLVMNSIRRRFHADKGTRAGRTTSSPAGSPADADKEHELEPQEFVRMSKKRKSKLIHSLRNKPIENPYKKAKDLWARVCPQHRNHLERVDLETYFKNKDIADRVGKLFDPNGSGIITRTMFKQAVVDMVNLRKSFTSAHKTFENAMAKLNMVFNIVVLLFVIVAFLIAFDVGVQQYAVSVSSLVVGGAFITGTSAKNAFESMIFIFVTDSYFTIMTIHILTTEMKRGDGLRVLSPNHVLASRHIHNLSRSGDHIENVRMDIPLFSSGRTIQKLKQKIQTYVETEAAADFQKIDVILNATNNRFKDGTSKACLQILFRVFHRGRWVDSEFGPRKLKAILFLREVLNELEQEDLKDLITLRRSLGYAHHLNPTFLQEIQAEPESQSVLNEAGVPLGCAGAMNDPRGFHGILAHNALDATTSSMQTGCMLPHQSQAGGEEIENRRLEAQHVFAPETIQLSTNSANYQPFPNDFHFQR
ncbi:hypothetical protein BGX28_003490 [Mortierella sp. GBA30]|nr:hypothetical protein BGX28_003490 [Mortierella sp. GBA30]